MNQTGSSTSGSGPVGRDIIRAPFDRRRFLKVAGGGLAALGAAPVLAACGSSSSTTSSSGGTKTLRLLMWSHFVPGFDSWFDGYAKAWGQKNKVTVIVDHVPTNTVVTHFASEVAANSGHDLVLLQEAAQPAVFAPHLVDLTSLASKIGAANGGWVSLADFAIYQGKWITLPEFYIRYPGIYRKDLWDAVGAPAPTTMTDLTKYGPTLKGKGHPIGVGYGHDDDSEIWCMGVMWGHGASVVKSDGTTLNWDSTETRDALNYAKQLYASSENAEVLSWNDSSNNEYLDSKVGSYICNPISAYRTATPALQKLLYLAPPPAGPVRRMISASFETWVMPKWSKVQSTGEQFLSDYFDEYTVPFTHSTGYNMPFLKKYLTQPMPIIGTGKLSVLQDAATWTRWTGWPGPANPQAGKVFDTYMLSSTFSKYVTGQSNLADTIASGTAQLKTIYG